MNTITVTGRLTHDPVRRSVTVEAEERTVVTLAVAVDAHRRSDDTCFIDVIVWGRPGEACAAHLHKGRQLAITGRLELSRWTAEDGTRHQRHRIVAAEVEFLDRPATAEQAA
jgi:single-strand DNA-binding protein